VKFEIVIKFIKLSVIFLGEVYGVREYCFGIVLESIVLVSR